MPGFLKLPKGRVKLDYSDHALEEAEFDRAGNLLGYLPDVFDFDAHRPIEVTTDQTLAYDRGLFRMSATPTHDLCLVVCRPDGTRSRVASVWANSVRDTHRSLRTDRYVQPPAMRAD
jgi:hypothetical protein